MFKRLKYNNQEDWLELRTKGIGGSDAAAIIGMNPYMSNVDLWQYKTDVEMRPNVDNAYTRYGHQVEPCVREILNADYDGFFKVTNTNELLARVDKPYLRASLDGEIEVFSDFEITSYFKEHYNNDVSKPRTLKIKKGMKGVYEGKATFVLSSMSKEKWNNKIPDNYYCQILHYLIVTDYDFVILSAILNWEDKNGVRTHEIRNYALLKEDVIEDMKFLEEKETEFWKNYVETKKEPPLKVNL